MAVPLVAIAGAVGVLGGLFGKKPSAEEQFAMAMEEINKQIVEENLIESFQDPFVVNAEESTINKIIGEADEAAAKIGDGMDHLGDN